MTSAGGHWFSTNPAKVAWVFLVSPLLCIAAGSVIGAGVFTLVNVWRFGIGEADPVRGYAAFLLYSLLVTVPFGGLAGLVAALLIVALGHGSHRGATLHRWLRTGGQLGAFVGLVCPLLLADLGFGDDGPALLWFLVYGITGSLAGGLVGFALGALAWREFGGAP